jgi:hypothetical protein
MHLFCTTEHDKLDREFREALETLRSKQNALEIEWASTLDKINRILGRIAKRAEVAERLEAAHEEAEPPALSIHREPGTTFGTIGGGMLSPHQKQIQQLILRRRSGG